MKLRECRDYADWYQRNRDCFSEIAFVDALLAVLDGQPPALPDENPYAGVVRQVIDAIAAYESELHTGL